MDKIDFMTLMLRLQGMAEQGIKIVLISSDKAFCFDPIKGLTSVSTVGEDKFAIKKL